MNLFKKITKNLICPVCGVNNKKEYESQCSDCYNKQEEKKRKELEEIKQKYSKFERGKKFKYLGITLTVVNNYMDGYRNQVIFNYVSKDGVIEVISYRN